MDLRSDYLGLALRTPLVASSSPLTGTIDGLRRLEDAGVAAVVLPSLFEEEITETALAVDGVLEAGAGVFAEALDYLPGFDVPAVGPEAYLQLVAAARSALGIPVIASLNGATPGGWTAWAGAIEQAGAHALELNLYQVAADPAQSAADVEARDLELVAAVRAAVRLPLAVKVGPYYSAFGHFAHRLVAAGADALVLFNRFYQPDVDLDELNVSPSLTLSTSAEARLALRWIALLRGRVALDLAGAGGVHAVKDVVKLLLVGADVVTLASALLERGPEHVTELVNGLDFWLAEHDYDSVAQLRGALAQTSAPDPGAFERANYLETLSGYAFGYRVGD